MEYDISINLERESTRQAFMTGVYGWMVAALSLSGVSAGLRELRPLQRIIFGIPWFSDLSSASCPGRVAFRFHSQNQRERGGYRLPRLLPAQRRDPRERLSRLHRAVGRADFRRNRPDLRSHEPLRHESKVRPPLDGPLPVNGRHRNRNRHRGEHVPPLERLRHPHFNRNRGRVHRSYRLGHPEAHAFADRADGSTPTKRSRSSELWNSHLDFINIFSPSSAFSERETDSKPRTLMKRPDRPFAVRFFYFARFACGVPRCACGDCRTGALIARRVLQSVSGNIAEGQVVAVALAMSRNPNSFARNHRD